MNEQSNDRNYYDQSSEAISLAELRRHCLIVNKYIVMYEPRLRKYAGKKSLRMLELGAGTCATSLILSRSEGIGDIVCLDISIKRMQTVFPLSVQAVGDCVPGKIRMVEGHFDARLPFGDEEFDVIVFDGALHHARSMWFILGECRRILRSEGLLIAQREQYLGLVTASRKLKLLLRTPEVRAGVAENAYLRSQYWYYLRAAGFGTVKFLPVSESIVQSLVGVFNGLLYSKWVIWARSLPKV